MYYIVNIQNKVSTWAFDFWYFLIFFYCTVLMPVTISATYENSKATNSFFVIRWWLCLLRVLRFRNFFYASTFVLHYVCRVIYFPSRHQQWSAENSRQFHASHKCTWHIQQNHKCEVNKNRSHLTNVQHPVICLCVCAHRITTHGCLYHIIWSHTLKYEVALEINKPECKW